jgi:hypothetical protein
MGKHVKGLRFLSTLMADSPPLSADVAFYQRLLARDHGEAADIIERHVKAGAVESVYDALLIPALDLAERDRLEGRLSDDEEEIVDETMRELLADLPAATRDVEGRGDESGDATPAAESGPLARKVTVLSYPATSVADELALHMLARLLEDTPLTVEVLSNRTLVSELIAAVQERGDAIVCIADLPPSAPSKTRQLIKKLRAALPDLTIVVGRWAPPAFADQDTSALVAAGAAHVSSAMVETRNQLRQLAELSPRNGAGSPRVASTLVA